MSASAGPSNAAPDFKLILVGDGGVGKTSFMMRYKTGKFKDFDTTMGIEASSLRVHTDLGEVFVNCWDIAGAEKMGGLTNACCRDAKAAIVCYDVTSPESFLSLQHWVDKVTAIMPRPAIIIVGNKLDLVEADASLRRVDAVQASRFVAELNIRIEAGKAKIRTFEVSAKSGFNVDLVFQSVVRGALEKEVVTTPLERSVIQDSNTYIELSCETQRRVDALFAPEHRAAATILLVERCGRNLPFMADCDAVGLERCRFAALKMSRGSLDELRQAIKRAEYDWRDLLVDTDFANDVTAHQRWFPGQEVAAHVPMPPSRRFVGCNLC